MSSDFTQFTFEFHRPVMAKKNRSSFLIQIVAHIFALVRSWIKFGLCFLIRLQLLFMAWFRFFIFDWLQWWAFKYLFFTNYARLRLIRWLQSCDSYIPSVVIQLSPLFSDGIALCSLIETLRPGSCPRFDLLSPQEPEQNLQLAFNLLSNYFHFKPEVDFTLIRDGRAERELVQLLSLIKLSNGRTQFLSDLVRLGFAGQSKLVDMTDQSSHQDNLYARGMGLLVGVKGRQSGFLIFCRRSTSLVIEITGPNLAYGCKRINTQLGVSSDEQQSFSAPCGSEQIDIDVNIQQSIVSVNYVPQQAGVYVINLISQGNHVLDSPYHVQVDEPSQQEQSNLPEHSTNAGSSSSTKLSDLHSPTETSMSHQPLSRRDPSSSSTATFDCMASSSSLSNFRMVSLKQLQPLDCPATDEGRVSRYVASFSSASSLPSTSNNQKPKIDLVGFQNANRLDESMELESMNSISSERGDKSNDQNSIERCSTICSDGQSALPSVQKLVVQISSEQPKTNVSSDVEDHHSSKILHQSIVSPVLSLQGQEPKAKLQVPALDELLDSTEGYNSSVERMFQSLYTQVTSPELPKSKCKIVAQESESTLSTRPALNGTVRSYLQSRQLSNGNILAPAQKSQSSLYTNEEQSLSRRRLLAQSKKKRESFGGHQDLSDQSPGKRTKSKETKLFTATFLSPPKTSNISQFDLKTPEPDDQLKARFLLHKNEEQEQSTQPSLNQSVQQKKSFWESLCSGDKCKSNGDPIRAARRSNTLISNVSQRINRFSHLPGESPKVPQLSLSPRPAGMSPFNHSVLTKSVSSVAQSNPDFNLFSHHAALQTSMSHPPPRTRKNTFSCPPTKTSVDILKSSPEDADDSHVSSTTTDRFVEPNLCKDQRLQHPSTTSSSSQLPPNCLSSKVFDENCANPLMTLSPIVSFQPSTNDSCLSRNHPPASVQEMNVRLSRLERMLEEMQVNNSRLSSCPPSMVNRTDTDDFGTTEPIAMSTIRRRNFQKQSTALVCQAPMSSVQEPVEEFNGRRSRGGLSSASSGCCMDDGDQNGEFVVPSATSAPTGSSPLLCSTISGPNEITKNLLLDYPENARFCQVSGDAIHTAHVGVENHFYVTSKYADCCLLSVGIQSVNGGEALPVVCEFLGNNMFRIYFRPLRAGYCLIRLRWANEHIPGSPFTCLVE